MLWLCGRIDVLLYSIASSGVGLVVVLNCSWPTGGGSEALLGDGHRLLGEMGGWSAREFLLSGPVIFEREEDGKELGAQRV